jgi:carboxymethylenebutenolidase
MQGREIVIPAGDGAPETPAFAAIPENASRGVVIIHEIFGRQPEIDRVVLRFAAAGYAAVAPDLFHRGRFTCLIDVFTRAMKNGQGTSVQQGKNARTWLCNEARVAPSQVGLIGFCFGGGYALASGSGWGAVSTNYGPIPSVDAMRGIGPVIGCYGKLDKDFRDAGRKLEKRLAVLGVQPEVHTFDGAGHSFLTDGHHPVAKFFMRTLALGDYPEAREEGWRRILSFFDRELAPR